MGDTCSQEHCDYTQEQHVAGQHSTILGSCRMELGEYHHSWHCLHVVEGPRTNGAFTAEIASLEIPEERSQDDPVVLEQKLEDDRRDFVTRAERSSVDPVSREEAVEDEIMDFTILEERSYGDPVPFRFEEDVEHENMVSGTKKVDSDEANARSCPEQMVQSSQAELATKESAKKGETFDLEKSQTHLLVSNIQVEPAPTCRADACASLASETHLRSCENLEQEPTMPNGCPEDFDAQQVLSLVKTWKESNGGQRYSLQDSSFEDITREQCQHHDKISEEQKAQLAHSGDEAEIETPAEQKVEEQNSQDVITKRVCWDIDIWLEDSFKSDPEKESDEHGRPSTVAETDPFDAASTRLSKQVECEGGAVVEDKSASRSPSSSSASSRTTSLSSVDFWNEVEAPADEWEAVTPQHGLLSNTFTDDDVLTRLTRRVDGMVWDEYASAKLTVTKEHSM